MNTGVHESNSDPVAQYLRYGWFDCNVADGFTMVAVVDLIVKRALTKGKHEGFDAIVKILKDADVTLWQHGNKHL